LKIEALQECGAFRCVPSVAPETKVAKVDDIGCHNVIMLAD
jgi:hypothetical protein